MWKIVLAFVAAEEAAFKKKQTNKKTKRYLVYKSTNNQSYQFNKQNQKIKG